ncbi:hypothetical protein ACJJTC_016639 [Scirpophaga incertulas]
MAVCKKCKQYLSKTKGDTIRCRELCGSTYHKGCIVEELCEECKKTGHVVPNSSPITTTKIKSADEAILEINGKLEIVHQLKKQMEDLTESLDFFEEQLKELLEFKKESLERIRSNERKIVELTQKNVHLSKCNRSLEERISYLEYKENEQNVELWWNPLVRRKSEAD